MDDNTSIQFRLRLAQINGININEAYNPQGKITHFIPKDKLDNHKKEMGFQGFDVETKPLPKTHPDHETHIGIVSKTPTESSHHMGAGAKRFGAGFLMHHKEMNEEKIDEAGSIKHTDRVLYSNKKRDPEIGHMRNIVHAYFVARANDKDPEDVMGAHQRAAEAAAAKHPTDHMGRPTHAAHVENAVRRHLEYVSGRIPNPSASGSDGNQVRQGLSGNQYTGHPDNTKGVNVSNQVRQGLRGNQN